MPQGEIVRAISDFVEAVNRGDQEAALAHLAGDVTILEDIAPFRWHGPDAGADWIAAMGKNAQSANITAVAMRIGAPRRVEIDEGHGYAVITGVLSLTGEGAALRS